MRLPALFNSGPADGGSVDTLLFVDVDGVLNVSIDDPGRKPLCFSPQNVERAIEITAACGDVSDLVETIVSTYRRRDGPGNDSTYAKYLSSMPSGVCDIMVARLAQLIRTAGDGCTVVLSSSWRDPRYTKQLRQLEENLQACLGKRFRFHHKTALIHDGSPDKRLWAIGDFIKTKGRRLFRTSRERRVLVLEDFHAHALDGWLCDGIRVDSTTAAEKYLKSQMPASCNASVKLVHTFARWTTPTGVDVRIGTGLDNEHFHSAMDFLGGTTAPSHCRL